MRPEPFVDGWYGATLGWDGLCETDWLVALHGASIGANTKVPFTRMCAECRKLHYSMHKCRLILRHTAPEWAPSKRRAGDDEHDEG